MDKITVNFTDGELEVSKELTAEEINLLVIHKPTLDFDDDSWNIVEFRYSLNRESFIIWIEKE